MADPVVLERGNAVNFKTWQWPKKTRLFVQSLDPNNGASVLIEAGLPPLPPKQETVNTGPGGTTYVDRSWGGTLINVQNDQGVTVKVWTE